MTWLEQVMDWIWGKLTDWVKAVWDIVTDAAAWFFEQLFGVIIWLLEQLDLTPVLQAVSAWGELPSEIINILGLLGIGTAAGIMTAAIVIRLLLQLIPFVRLGS